MEEDERLKLDYDQTTKYYYALADIRFKLLALVPIVTGTAISVVDKSGPPELIIFVGILGFVVTLGILIYDQRNTQIYDAIVSRAQRLERLLQLQGGAFSDRPPERLCLFGYIYIWHDRALAIIYSAALAGWTYLMTGGILHLLNVKMIAVLTILKLALPIAVFFCFFITLKSIHEKIAS